MCGRLTVTILAQMQNSFILESTFGQVVLYQWFSTEGILPPPPKEIFQEGDILGAQLGEKAGIHWVEVRDAAGHPIMHRADPQKRIILAKMLIMLLLRNPALDQS